ncbi:MAG: hypothetical protein SFX72_04980 [Isosphaeraceae bacterium]|nr:hypothetical protein [Isosphaeraceae bacterium]
MTIPLDLPEFPDVDRAAKSRLRREFSTFAVQGLPVDLPAHIRSHYGVDLTGRYAGREIRLPFGKGSGQLSMRAGQIEEAARAGLGFVVIKTLIAQSESGARSMEAWAVHAPRMVVEPIRARTGHLGWTVSWAGRGWSDSFDDYLELYGRALEIGRDHHMVIAPSVKYHLPGPHESTWQTDEYRHTTRALLDVWDRARLPDAGELGPALEKDFSPTLAGSDRASTRARILDWLEVVPRLIREAAGDRPLRLGLKLFNAVDDEDFQLEMLAQAHRTPSGADFLVHANRLFDPERTFDGRRGVAYGGPDLSDRNLRVLEAFRRSSPSFRPLELSGTGNIADGRIAARYVALGCTSLQIHTGFQLPPEAYPMKVGSKVERAIHRLCFDPDRGLIAWMLHIGRAHGLADGGMIRLLDVAALAG